jgi:hypothetical protein
MAKDLVKSISKAEEYLRHSQEIGIKSVALSWSENLKGAKIKIEGAKAEQSGM